MTQDITKNREVLTRFYWNAETLGELDVIDAIFDPDVILHSPFPGLPRGVEGLKLGVSLLRGAFPDFAVTEDDTIAEGDKVVVRCTISGTHRGDFLGVPPSGKGFRCREIMIARFREARIIELWSVVDELAQRKQLGWL